MAGNEVLDAGMVRNRLHAFLACPEALRAIKSMAPRIFFKA
jgi:hypothetical protein